MSPGAAPVSNLPQLTGKVLLTGSGGGIGQFLRPLFAAQGISLRLSDLQAPAQLLANESFIAADLTRPDQLSQAVAGIDCIVHMGGHSVEGPWDTILNSNIIGTWNLFDAARAAGVKRVVFASSNHAVGFYERSQVIATDVTVRPDSRYGVSKAFGEATGAFHADKFGMKVTCLRIGNVGPAPIDRRRLSIWLHPEDLFELILIGLTHPGIHYEVLYGMSDNQRGWWDNSRAIELGYRPKHRSEDYAARILAAAETPDPIGDRFQGGAFCTQDNPKRQGGS